MKRIQTDVESPTKSLVDSLGPTVPASPFNWFAGDGGLAGSVHDLSDGFGLNDGSLAPGQLAHDTLSSDSDDSDSDSESSDDERVLSAAHSSEGSSSTTRTTKARRTLFAAARRPIVPETPVKAPKRRRHGVEAEPFEVSDVEAGQSARRYNLLRLDAESGDETDEQTDDTRNAGGSNSGEDSLTSTVVVSSTTSSTTRSSGRSPALFGSSCDSSSSQHPSEMREPLSLKT